MGLQATEAARRAVAAMEGVEGPDGFARLDDVLLALARLPKAECAFARALRDDAIWPRRRDIIREREQVERKTLFPPSRYPSVDPAAVVREAQAQAATANRRVTAESHLGLALERLCADGLAEYGVRADRLQQALVESEFDNVAVPTAAGTTAVMGQAVDVFVCHASEDKETVARPIAAELARRGHSVWLDEVELTVGDSLRKKIDDALVRTRFGVVILSRSFFEKHWPERELAGLAAKEMSGRKVILPVWHEISHDEVVAYSPPLADRLAAKTAGGIPRVVDDIERALRG